QVFNVYVRAASAVAEPAAPAARSAAGARACSGPCPAAPPCLRIHVLWHLAEVGAECVVPLPGRRVRQDRVGLRDVLELLLGGRMGVDVRVVLASQLAVCPLDLVLAGVPPDTEDLIEVAVGHHSALATTTWAGRS